jgi:hypothetical protein
MVIEKRVLPETPKGETKKENPILPGPLRRLLGGSRTPCQNKSNVKKKNLLFTPISSGILAVPTFTPPTKDGPLKKEYDAWFNNISRRKDEKAVACNPKDWLFQVATCNADHVGPWRGAWETCQLVGVWQDEYHIICKADRMEIYVPQRFVRKKRMKIVRSPGQKRKKRKSNPSVIRTRVPKRRKKKVSPMTSPVTSPLKSDETSSNEQQSDVSKKEKPQETVEKKKEKQQETQKTNLVVKKKKTKKVERAVVTKDTINKAKNQRNTVTVVSDVEESTTTVVKKRPKKKNVRVERYERCLPSRPVRRVNYDPKPDMPCEEMTLEEISVGTNEQLNILKSRHQREIDMFESRYSNDSSTSCLNRMSSLLRRERFAHVPKKVVPLKQIVRDSKSREELLKEMHRRHQMEISSVLALSYMRECHMSGKNEFEKGWAPAGR